MPGNSMSCSLPAPSLLSFSQLERIDLSSNSITAKWVIGLSCRESHSESHPWTHKMTNWPTTITPYIRRLSSLHWPQFEAHPAALSRSAAV